MPALCGDHDKVKALPGLFELYHLQRALIYRQCRRATSILRLDASPGVFNRSSAFSVERYGDAMRFGVIGAQTSVSQADSHSSGRTVRKENVLCFVFAGLILFEFFRPIPHYDNGRSRFLSKMAADPLNHTFFEVAPRATARICNIKRYITSSS